MQALLFGDGGILAFGANTFDVAVVMPFVGYAVYTLLKKVDQEQDNRKLLWWLHWYCGCGLDSCCLTWYSADFL